VAGTHCNNGSLENVGGKKVLLVITPCKLMRCLPNFRRQVLSPLSRWQFDSGGWTKDSGKVVYHAVLLAWDLSISLRTVSTSA
jgi:hypothetical protein